TTIAGLSCCPLARELLHVHLVTLPHDDVRDHAAPEPRQVFDDFWSWMIRDEPEAIAGAVPDAAWLAFTRYYHSLPHAGDTAGIRRWLRGCWRGEAGWAARWIAARAPCGDVRVLDAGSGFGTYSMLFAEMGATVTGADLRPDRLHLAGRRAALRELR